MTEDELNAETQRLIALSDSLVAADRNNTTGAGADLFKHALTGCIALVFAAIPAWLASFAVDKQGALLVFCSMIIFYGCIEISNAVSGQVVAHVKIIDNINALRLALIDLSNRTGHATKSRAR